MTTKEYIEEFNSKLEYLENNMEKITSKEIDIKSYMETVFGEETEELNAHLDTVSVEEANEFYDYALNRIEEFRKNYREYSEYIEMLMQKLCNFAEKQSKASS